jgi:hypothetical protein
LRLGARAGVFLRLKLEALRLKLEALRLKLEALRLKLIPI